MKKKVIGLICLLFVLVLSACSTDDKNYAEEYNKFVRVEEELVKDNKEANINVMDSGLRHCVYYESMFETKGEDKVFVIKGIYEYDYLTGEKQKLNLSDEDIVSLRYAPDDMLLESDDNGNLLLLSRDYQKIAKTNLKELYFSNCDGEKCNLEILIDVRSDGKYIYALGYNDIHQQLLCIFDMNLKERSVFFPQNEWTLMVMNENTIQFVDNKESDMYSYEETTNSMKKQGKKNCSFLESVNVEYLSGNKEYDFFCFTNGMNSKENGIKTDYFIGRRDGKDFLIASFTNWGIGDCYIECISSDQNGGFWVWGTLEEEMKLYHFIPSENEESYSIQDNKKCCKIGTLLEAREIQWEINSFNRVSQDYYLQTIVYQDIYEDRDIALMHLFMDCQEGKLDGIILDGIEDEIVKNDVLLDLENYFQQYSVLTKEEFIPHYFESVTDEKGRIYALYPSFSAFGYAYTDKIDFSNLTNYDELVSEEQTFLSRSSFSLDLSQLLVYSGNMFVDEKNSEVHVTEPSFQNMLRFLKSQGQRKAGFIDTVMQYCDGETLTVRARILEPCDYLYFDELFEGKVIFSNVGVEGLTIAGKKGELGICSKSNYPEAFYDFYNYIFTPQFYHEVYFSGMNMPVLRNEYNFWKEYFLKTETYEDSYGVTHDKYDFQFGIAETERIIQVGTITEEKANEAISALEQVKYIKPMKEIYISIICEEANAYFDGRSTLDEACAAMEYRLSLALEEQK